MPGHCDFRPVELFVSGEVLRPALVLLLKVLQERHCSADDGICRIDREVRRVLSAQAFKHVVSDADDAHIIIALSIPIVSK